MGDIDGWGPIGPLIHLGPFAFANPHIPFAILPIAGHELCRADDSPGAIGHDDHRSDFVSFSSSSSLMLLPKFMPNQISYKADLCL
jgi:hypothetical protein